MAICPIEQLTFRPDAPSEPTQLVRHREASTGVQLVHGCDMERGARVGGARASLSEVDREFHARGAYGKSEASHYRIEEFRAAMPMDHTHVSLPVAPTGVMEGQMDTLASDHAECQSHASPLNASRGLGLVWSRRTCP